MNEDKPERMPNTPPFVRFVCSAIPMVFDDSLSYYEALCALWKYVQGMTDVINNNATLEEEYILKFNELKTFVDTYFDNLDVQEEINNKLDAMVEDGTLQTLLTNYLVICGGNAKELGCAGDGVTDDTDAINSAITTLKNNGINKLVFPKGTYIVSDSIYVPSNFELSGLEEAVIKYVGEGTNTVLFPIYGINATNYVHDITIKDLTIDGTDQVYKGGNTMDTPAVTHTDPCAVGIKVFRINFAKNLTIENCVINDFYGDGVIINYSTNVTIKGNTLTNVGSGNIQLSGQIAYDSHGDGIVAFASHNIRFLNNTVINRRVYQAGIAGAIGKPCGRSGIEFEFPLNVNYDGDPDDLAHNAVDYDLTEPVTVGTKQYRFAYGLSAENNYVYGYTKGVHLEDCVVASIKNNTIIHNCIGILHSTSGKTSIEGNFIDTDFVGASPQTGGYDGYYGCIAISSYTSRDDSKTNLITNNTICGEGRGIVLGRDKVVISNNNFRSQYGVFQLLDTIRDITIEGNIFTDANVENFANAIYLKTSYFVNILNNMFSIVGNPTNVILAAQTNTRKLSLVNNTFVSTHTLGEVVKLVDCYDCYIDNNRLDGECDSFVRGNTAFSITFTNNKLSECTNNVLKMTSGFYRFSVIDNNYGNIAYSAYSPNETLAQLRDGYFTRSQEVIKYNIENATTTRGWACLSSGIYTDRAWNASPAVGKYYINSSNVVYLCESVGKSTPTVEPSHASGSVTESDGYTWKYAGNVAVFKILTF